MPDYELQIRDIPERKLLTISRHLHSNETDAFFDEAFARLRKNRCGDETGRFMGDPCIRDGPRRTDGHRKAIEVTEQPGSQAIG